ncbi:hypothetical protein EA658_04145 [Pseudoxanthomonas winnipegensis]|jgi:hypothetical protein|uniref:NERD domain-containing protein n=1 Tax=Pseudoxanthomonas winnipegensis TaxID=2480810 RepID=A0ABY1WJ41_9GAMM|nr:hypothetical protein [Pseudoxanthomonas winnipegensis]TAA09846.1 hypothetical protein EA659_09770 [Pseudoxanthomonas winnipegensis]TAA22774.1 hypothetical protein EA658_04145 [Pseudoxanthomonas winnipegensis]TAH73186.1 hypothetical protein EA657_05685 [Pseudoxanthomonas winnipegensis]
MAHIQEVATTSVASKDAIKEKGDVGESDLNAWLGQSGLSYVAICQARENFAPLFTGEIKRPDFMVLLDSIGLIAVDAKNFEVTEWDGASCFTLSVETELLRAVAFERMFRIPLWYAYRCEESEQLAWYWISALKAVEVGTRRVGRHGDFLTIELKHFARVVVPDDMARLYAQRLPGVSRIAALPLST